MSEKKTQKTEPVQAQEARNLLKNVTAFDLIPPSHRTLVPVDLDPEIEAYFGPAYVPDSKEPLLPKEAEEIGFPRFGVAFDPNAPSGLCSGCHKRYALSYLSLYKEKFYCCAQCAEDDTSDDILRLLAAEQEKSAKLTLDLATLGSEGRLRLTTSLEDLKDSIEELYQAKPRASWVRGLISTVKGRLIALLNSLPKNEEGGTNA